MAAREGISFIIPAYNCAPTVREAVGSIYDGNFQAGDEIILVDDRSSDNTAAVLNDLRESGPAIRVLGHKENRGTAAAGRNTGIEAAETDLLFCLDADNVLAPASVGSLCQHLRASQADAAAFGELHYFRTSAKDVTHKWIYKESVTLADALAGYVWPGPSGNYLFTRESWIRAGRYHEPYLENRSLDSWMFGIDQLGTGAKMVTLPDSWYFHRYGHDSHYVKNLHRGNQSMAALTALIPFLDRFDEDDVEYMFSRAGRQTWYERLTEHPIRLKSGAPGENGRIEYVAPYQSREHAAGLAAMLEKVQSRLRGQGR